MVSYPSSCEITTVKPYLGSFNIDVTIPSADAFITLVLSAFLENSQGETKTVSVEDEWLVENKLDIGSEWPEDTEEEKTK